MYASTISCFALVLGILSGIPHSIDAGRPGFLPMGLFLYNKIFYTADQDNYDLINLERTAADYKALDKVSTALRLAGAIPELGIVAKIFGGIINAVSSITSNRDSAFWALVEAKIDKAVLAEKLSSLSAEIQTFQNTFSWIQDGTQNTGLVESGIVQIQNILNYFKEESTIMRKYPLHSAPILLKFLPIVSIYVGYIAKQYPNTQPQWRVSMVTQSLELLNLYKTLTLADRKRAIDWLQWTAVGSGGIAGYREYVQKPYDQNEDKGQTSETVLPLIRCYGGGNWGCTEKAIRYREPDIEYWRGACIKDNFSGHTLLIPVESMWTHGGWSRNCVNDYNKAIELVYETVFWKIGALIV